MFWADELVQKLKKRGQSQTIATAITPSGFIHVGNLREVTVGDVAYKALIKNNISARFIWIADDFDRLRKVYPFLPKNYIQYIGFPLSKIPDPEGRCHQSYAEHYTADFLATLPKLGIKPEILSATKLYSTGVYTEKITIALENRLSIKKILEEVSRRQLDDDYSPYQPYCNSCQKDLNKIIKYDLTNTRVQYHCQECGTDDWSDYSKGQGKLSWRVDWAARWSIFNVTAEPLGKEHAAAGGSYDTGLRIAKEIFNYQAPEKIFYEFIYLKGSTGKMSSSLGNVVSSSEMVSFVPPASLRYLLIKNKNRHVTLDPGVGLIQLIDEYTKLEKSVIEKTANLEEVELYNYCQTGKQKSRSHIPFNHLVNAYQSANGNLIEVLRILKQTGFVEDKKLIEEDLVRVKNWLDKYAPENIKFCLQKKIPDIELSINQKKLLLLVVQILTKETEPAAIHNSIYQSGKELGLTPKETFEAIYQILLNKKSGPKLGWFLSILDKDFVISRLKQGAL